ncbi:hypothetical protein CICLE_v10029774mg [Citrus x clementina]|uniref:Uncharacterized protein n=1 Tax=Citrus clementina TaxID=85681 RepID=V4RRQ5_CITCL|nr:hypothetical protein CICLE_v10029774mg [Citrus x clementina]
MERELKDIGKVLVWPCRFCLLVLCPHKRTKRRERKRLNLATNWNLKQRVQISGSCSL